jgi:twitching motility two-component system response regulator PilH
MKKVSKTVMIVDDSRTERAFLATLLQNHGYNVLVAESGDDAVQRAPEAQPDVIVMDVLMPGMNGFQATRLICRGEATRHIPVIMCSTKSNESDKVWALRQGARAYVTKPVDADELLGHIASAG